MPRTGMTGAEIREKAIDATISRMRRDGFEKIRLVDVARDLDVSHAALYGHFADKASLLDAVSEKWLTAMDDALEQICRKEKDPLQKLQDWFLKLHRSKREKVLHDPELYKAFNLSSEAMKPFVVAHLKNMNRQLLGMVNEAIEQKQLHPGSPEKIVAILRESMVGFSHPKLVVQFLDVKREPLLKQTLEVVLRGLR